MAEVLASNPRQDTIQRIREALPKWTKVYVLWSKAYNTVRKTIGQIDVMPLDGDIDMVVSYEWDLLEALHQTFPRAQFQRSSFGAVRILFESWSVDIRSFCEPRYVAPMNEPKLYAHCASMYGLTDPQGYFQPHINYSSNKIESLSSYGDAKPVETPSIRTVLWLFELMHTKIAFDITDMNNLEFLDMWGVDAIYGWLLSPAPSFKFRPKSMIYLLLMKEKLKYTLSSAYRREVTSHSLDMTTQKPFLRKRRKELKDDAFLSYLYYKTGWDLELIDNILLFCKKPTVFMQYLVSQDLPFLDQMKYRRFITDEHVQKDWHLIGAARFFTQRAASEKFVLEKMWLLDVIL